MRPIVGYPFRKANSIPDRSEYCISIHIYTFKNKRGTIYIVNVEQYLYDVYIIKFFTKALRSTKTKFNILTKERDARRIIFTCIEIGISIFKKNQNASFGFIGSPTIPELERVGNKLDNTKRYRVYSKFAKFFFSPDSFLHTVNDDFSLYILYNKSHIEQKNDLQETVQEMFTQHYDVSELLGI